MRRIVMWVASTVTVVVLMLGYHTSTAGRLATSAAAEPVIEQSADPGTSGSSPTTTPTPSASTPSPAAAAKGATYTGEVAQTRWGPVQVAVTVAGGRVTDVQVPQYPYDNPKDQEINSYALPILVQETLDQQTASIDMVSGATVTSKGYLSSLQSALDQAGL